MVDIIDAYRIVNQSIVKVAEDLVLLDMIEFEDVSTQVRMEDATYSLAERRDRLSTFVVAHDLQEYTNKFYSILLDSSDMAWIDYLINASSERIDLTEFGEYV